MLELCVVVKGFFGAWKEIFGAGGAGLLVPEKKEFFWHGRPEASHPSEILLCRALRAFSGTGGRAGPAHGF